MKTNQEPIVAIWSPDRKFKIVRKTSINQGPMTCQGIDCKDTVWTRGRTSIVSPEGVARFCLLCLVDACETGFVSNWIQMSADGPDPLDALVRDYFETGLGTGYIERESQ